VDSVRYQNAIYDEAEQRWVSDAEVAEIEFTAFTGRREADHLTTRLIVRRVRRLNPRQVPAGQTEAFAVYRYHAVFTDSTESMLAAEATHRDHAVIEQVIAELKNGPLAHLPSGVFTANAAWLACATISHNLTRAAGALAGDRHTRERVATLRRRLIDTPRGSRTPPTSRSSTYPAVGPGNPAWTSCSAAPCTTPSPQPANHRPAGPDRRTTRGTAGQTGSSPTPRPNITPQKINYPTGSRSTVDPG